MAFYFESEWEGDMFPECESVLAKVFEKACDYVDCPYECTVNMLLTDDSAIHSMNKEFRGIDRATDVLSFPMVDYEKPGCFDGLENHMEDYFEPDSGELLLGDIVISVERAMAQAAEYGHSLKREMAFLTAHSMLHLFGYDHMDDAEREEMERMQEEILAELGIGRDAE
ncbi:MAG: rRNA maturation RNase YbeY [Lachnospiraceae bacterium]|nr:rRNA maturation RNase YbeY [Lachnospiraceae bacterium]